MADKYFVYRFELLKLDQHKNIVQKFTKKLHEKNKYLVTDVCQRKIEKLQLDICRRYRAKLKNCTISGMLGEGRDKEAY